MTPWPFTAASENKNKHGGSFRNIHVQKAANAAQFFLSSKQNEKKIPPLKIAQVQVELHYKYFK